MQFTSVRNVEEFEALSTEWNALLEKGASHVPFLRNDYLSAWWKHKGGGEWPQSELCVIAARDDAGDLMGIAPLFLAENREGQKALMLLGSIEISDYLDVICPPENLTEFLEGLLKFLDLPEFPEWQVLDWYNLLEDSPTLSALQKTAGERNAPVRVEELQHCPYVPLPDDWDEYLSKIDKKQRHEIRRKIRRAESAMEEVTFVPSTSVDELNEAMEDFFRLMASDPEKEKFLTPEMRDQMKALAHTAAENDYLQLSFITVDGERAAGYMNFDYLNQIWVYNSGFDPRFRELSLGWVLLGYLIQSAIEQGREAFDFMRGDEDYKYKFGGIDRRVVRTVVERPGRASGE